MEKCNKEEWNGCCCCNCKNHLEDTHHCTTVTGPQDYCVCGIHKGWICKAISEDSGEVRYHSGWSEHGMCEMHTPIDKKKSCISMWIIIDAENKEPIIIATSKEEAEQQLFDYMGWGNPIHEGTVDYLGYTPIEYSEHEGDYIGFYKFKSLVPSVQNKTTEWETDTFQLHCKELNKFQK